MVECQDPIVTRVGDGGACADVVDLLSLWVRITCDIRHVIVSCQYHFYACSHQLVAYFLVVGDDRTRMDEFLTIDVWQ